jgi:hypothetical protein
MSHQSFRKKTRKVLTNMDLKFIQSSIKKNNICGKKYLNLSNICEACSHGCAFDISTRREEPLSQHHISYFPEKIAFVHVSCHFAIHHRGLRPDLIEYVEGDSRKFHEEKPPLRKNIGSASA